MGQCLEGHPHSPKGDVSYVGALKQTVRSDAHGLRSRHPRSQLTVLNIVGLRLILLFRSTDSPQSAPLTGEIRARLLRLSRPRGVRDSYAHAVK
jgi:hypothetical protein